MNTLRRAIGAAAVALLLGAGGPALAQPYPASEPPPLQREVVPPHPGGRMVWHRGHWRWNGRWIWVPGRYVAAPRPGARWVPGHWVRRWVWVDGHWR